MEFFLVRIFPHLDRILFSANAGIYGPEKSPYFEYFSRNLMEENTNDKEFK